MSVPGRVMSIMFPQNGVVEEPMRFISGDSSPHTAVGSSMDTQNGIVGSAETPKRPKILGVNTKDAYATKHLLGDSDDADRGSLPSTPELQSDSEADICPAGDEVLVSDTRQLVSRFLGDFTGRTKHQWNESKALSTLKRVVGGLLEKHKYTYNGMLNKLSLDDRGDDASFISDIAASMFSDKTTNWGRIVSLVAFGAVVSQHLKEKGRKECVELVGQEICTYLLSHQRDWLVKNNGWDGFVEFFREADPESTVRNALMAFAGVAGIGATLALFIR